MESEWREEEARKDRERKEREEQEARERKEREEKEARDKKEREERERREKEETLPLCASCNKRVQDGVVSKVWGKKVKKRNIY